MTPLRPIQVRAFQDTYGRMHLIVPKEGVQVLGSISFPTQGYLLLLPVDGRKCELKSQ